MSIKVFYNKSCKICNAEINHYKKISKKKIFWENIIDNKNARILTSKSYKQLIRRIHVINDDKLFIGARAFLEIWKNIPRYKFFYKILKIKPFFIFFYIFYEIVALFLFLKNRHLLKKK
tara:strand:- start:18 stop:374 length:357 start_codon:yes stop_codon:yes gene_type:complete